MSEIRGWGVKGPDGELMTTRVYVGEDQAWTVRVVLREEGPPMPPIDRGSPPPKGWPKTPKAFPPPPEDK